MLKNKKMETWIIGILVSIFMTITSISIYALILTYTKVSEKGENIVIMLITAISIFIGSLVTGKRSKTNGIINGGIVGVGYIVMIYFISSIINNNFQIGIQGLISLIICIVLGILGGIIGVNIQ